MKFFYILQLAYWFHAFPELYFQKTKKVSTKCKWKECQTKQLWQWNDALNPVFLNAVKSLYICCVNTNYWSTSSTIRV